MKFGVATFVTDEGIGPAALGRALEERGFDSVFVAEHSHIPVSRRTPYPAGGELPRNYYRTLDPFVALTAMATATTDLLVGTGIALVPQRDVLHVAKEVASLDLVSGGRVLFGVGAGWNREEMANHGVDPTTRGALLNEQLAALKELWTADAAEFHGEHVDFDPVYSWPKPVRTPHPPIYVGGQSDAALNRLRVHGDAWFPTVLGDFHTSVGELGRVRARLAEHGRADVPVTIAGLDADPEAVQAYADAGVDRVAFVLDTLPEDRTLAALDDLAALTGRY